MKKIQNILISGGNGRIGSSLSNYLLNKGHKIVVGDLHFNNITKKKENKNSLFLFKSDLTKEKNIQRFINFGIKNLGSIDVFFIVLIQKQMTGACH